MISGRVMAGRRAIHAQQDAEAGCSEHPGGPASPRARKHLFVQPPAAVQGGQPQPLEPVLVTDTAIVHGAGITPLVAAPSSPFPPTPPRVQMEPALRMGSMHRETSQTDPPLLDELLPLLSPASGGSFSDPSRRHMGTADCALSLAKSILGVGIVAMPHAFLLLGALPATAAFVAMAALTYYSCRCLVAAAAAGQLSYTGVLAAQLGTWAAVALDLSMVLNCFGMMVVYLIAAGDVIVSDEWQEEGAPAWLHALLSSRPLVLGLLTLLVLAPLLSFRRLRHTTAVSVLGVAAVSLWGGVTLYLVAVLALRGQAHALRPWPAAELLHESWREAALQIAAALPVILMSFMCQMSFFSVVREMEAPASPRRMRHAAAGAIAVSLAATLVLAAGSEAAFGGDIGQNVLSNFSLKQIRELLHERHAQLARTLALSVRSAYLLSVLATFPLQMQPFRDSLSWLRRPRHSYRNLQAAELHGWQFYTLTYVTLAAAFLLATQLPSVWLPLQLIGATAGAMIAFILPGALALRHADWRLGGGGGGGSGGAWAGAGGALLVCCGLLLMAAGIASAALHLH